LAHSGEWKLDSAQKRFLKEKTFFGNEIVANTRRLCLTQPATQGQILTRVFARSYGQKLELKPRLGCRLSVNLFLHGIGGIDGDIAISPADSLVADTGIRVDYVLTNPPFGKKSSMTITNDEGEEEREELTYNRQDFWTTTSNKQLNFVQHVRTILKSDGKAAVVVPDNVLFEGGAGEVVRKRLLECVELHTILRLPTGFF
jgi:type I restriction enzyme M protein